jgi:hypothetical protein
MEATIKTLATKDDIANVKEYIAEVNLGLSNRIGDMMKWMFVFWVGQLGAMIGIALMFLKK